MHRRGAGVVHHIVRVVGVGFLVVATLTLTLARCGTDDRTTGVVPPADLTTAESAPGADAVPAPGVPAAFPRGPQVVEWGVNGQQLAVVVKNQTRSLIVSATVRIQAYDENHRLIVASTGPQRSKCCTILGLPPRQRFGLFLFVGPRASDVRSVRVDYVDTDVRTDDPKARGTYSTEVTALDRQPDDTVVTATITAHGPVTPFLVGQAFVTGPDGLIGVISGRFYCFEDGASRRMRMQLKHPVPAGSRVESVVAYPVPPGQPTYVTSACHTK